MKKIFSIVMLLAGWCLASCNEDVQEVVVSHSGEKMSVRAVIGNQPDSRVVLTQKDNGNIKTEWKAGDAFLGVAGSDVISFTDAKLNGSTADFTPNANVEDGTVVNALYPLTEDLATVAASADGFEISLASQNGTLEGLADYTYMTANATAANETLDFTFKHEIVILRLTGMTLPEGVTSVSEVVVSGSGISDVAMANLSGATPTVAVSATDCSVNVKGNFTVTNKVMEDVYVAFFPTSEISDLAVSVISSANKPCHYSYSGSVQFEAGKVYTLNAKELSGIIRVSQYANYPNEKVYYAIDKTDMAAINTYIVESDYFKDIDIIMLNDIDLQCGTTSWVMPYVFNGNFDGRGHTISGLYISTYKSCNGLFGKTSDGVFKNLTIEGTINSQTWGQETVGAFSGQAGGCTFINCHNKCNISGRSEVCGIAPTLSDCFFMACSNSGKLYAIDGEYSKGIAYGIASSDAYCIGCYNEGELKGTFTRGILQGASYNANNHYGEAYGCYNIGTMTATASTGTPRLGIMSASYNAVTTHNVWLTSQAVKCGGQTDATTNVGCTSIEEVNNNVSVLNEGIKQWNTANPTNTCNYHYVKGTNGKGPQLVYGAPN